jgi:hypothetical protein
LQTAVRGTYTTRKESVFQHLGAADQHEGVSLEDNTGGRDLGDRRHVRTCPVCNLEARVTNQLEVAADRCLEENVRMPST